MNYGYTQQSGTKYTYSNSNNGTPHQQTVQYGETKYTTGEGTRRVVYYNDSNQKTKNVKYYTNHGSNQKQVNYHDPSQQGRNTRDYNPQQNRYNNTADDPNTYVIPDNKQQNTLDYRQGKQRAQTSKNDFDEGVDVNTLQEELIDIDNLDALLEDIDPEAKRSANTHGRPQKTQDTFDMNIAFMPPKKEKYIRDNRRLPSKNYKYKNFS